GLRACLAALFVLTIPGEGSSNRGRGHGAGHGFPWPVKVLARPAGWLKPAAKGDRMAFLIACSSRAEQFAAEIRVLEPGLDLRIAPHIGRAEDIDTALVWQPPPGLLRTLPSLKLIVSVGAGVDALIQDPTLPDVPVVRFVDP